MEFLAKVLRLSGVSVRLEAGKLKYEIHASASAQDSIELLKAHKKDLLSYLAVNGSIRAAEKPYAENPKLTPVLTEDQKSLWFLDKIKVDSSSDSLSVAYQLPASISLDKLRQVLSIVADRQSVLRYRFKTATDGGIDVVESDEHSIIEVEEIDTADSDIYEQWVRGQCSKNVGRVFNLVEGPLLRFVVYQAQTSSMSLQIIVHHIVSDGTSIQNMLQEIAYFLDCDDPISRAKLIPRFPFEDFAIRRNLQLTSQYLESETNRWKQELDDRALFLDLDISDSRPAVQSDLGSRAFYAFDDQTFSAIKIIQEAHSLTSQMLFSALFSIVLRSHIDESKFFVGYPSSLRGSENESLISGLMVNTSILPVNIELEDKIPEILKSIRNALLSNLENVPLPFTSLVQRLNPPRDLSYNPLFQFYIQVSEYPVLNVAGSVAKKIEFDTGTSQFDISFNIYIKNDKSFNLEIEYDSSIYQQSSIDALVDEFRAVANLVAEVPRISLSDLQSSLFESRKAASRDERDKLLHQFNDTYSNIEQHKSIQTLFENQVEETPQAIALRQSDKTLSYAELETYANQLAHILVERGVSPGDLVGICMERSFEMVIGVLATLKAGAAYVPIDPSYPVDRIAYMLQDAAPGVLLTVSEFQGDLPTFNGAVIALDTQWRSMADKLSTPPEALGSQISSQSVAYIIYTSGSTGRPKGVQGTQGGVINRCQWMWKRYPFETDEVACLKTAISFVDSIWELFGSLLQGTPTVIFSNDQVRDPEQFVTMLRDYRISRLVVVPTLLTLLLDELDSSGETLPYLSLCSASGETLPTTTAQRFHDLLPHARLLNLYGSSEVAADVTSYEVDTVSGQSTVPIGKPIDNTQVYIVDQQGSSVVPIGVVGEIYIGGNNVAAGYLNQPELSAERFIPNHFLNDQSARLFKTGDLGRWLPDGNIEYRGRRDRQVKIRGFRIELDEVESNIVSIDAIDQAVVILSGEGEQQQLVAFFSSSEAISGDNIRSVLAERLPDYMVPTTYMKLDSIPLTTSGKVDWSALQTIDIAPLTSEDYIAPESESELILADIWCDLLGIKEISMSDNFFKLGGHSLLLMRMLMAARKKGISLSPNTVFEHPTIAELAEIGNSNKTAIVVEQGVVTGPMPLTPAQQRFLYERHSQHPHHWNISQIKQSRSLEPAALQQALKAVLAHHDSLRLRLSEKNGVWSQENLELLEDIPFSTHDLAHLNSDEQVSYIENSCASLQETLDLVVGPVVRLAHFACGPDQPDRLFLTCHHFAVDGFSWPLLWEDLETAYCQFSSGRKISLPDKTSSFRDWSRQLQQLAQEPMIYNTVQAWLDLPWKKIASLPTDAGYPKGDNTNVSCEAVIVELDTTTTGVLVNSESGLKSEQLVISALAMCLSKWTKSDTVLIDLLSHGRDAMLDSCDLSRTVGFMLSYHPLVLTLPPQETPIGTAQYIRQQIEQFPSGNAFDLIRFFSADENTRNSFNQLPRGSVLLNYVGEVNRDHRRSLFEPSAESTGRDSNPNGLRNHPIAVRVSITDKKMRIQIVFSRNLFSRSTIEMLGGELKNVLLSINNSLIRTT